MRIAALLIVASIYGSTALAAGQSSTANSAPVGTKESLLRSGDRAPEPDLRDDQRIAPSKGRDAPDLRPPPMPAPEPIMSRNQEEQLLVDAGMDRSDARLWLNAGFSAYEVLEWRPFVNSYRHSGRNNLQEATNWWSWGWTPELADYFVHELCGGYQQAERYSGTLEPHEIIDRLGDQCTRH
jgi:hypothetical protein